LRFAACASAFLFQIGHGVEMKMNVSSAHALSATRPLNS
jgi:hypothetical protein